MQAPVEDWVGQRYSHVTLTEAQRGIISAGYPMPPFPPPSSAPPVQSAVS